MCICVVIFLVAAHASLCGGCVLMREFVCTSRLSHLVTAHIFKARRCFRRSRCVLCVLSKDRDLREGTRVCMRAGVSRTRWNSNESNVMLEAQVRLCVRVSVRLLMRI